MIDPAIFAGDPPIPADGSCATCGGPRRPERSRRYAGITAQLDPFCSKDCALAWRRLPSHQLKPGPKGIAA